MPTKQLEILVNARDNASAAFKQVGESAGGLSSKLTSLNDIAAAGRGLKSALRDAKAIALAYAVIPVAIDAVKGAFATINGDAERAASGQRALLNSIKEFPIVGKIAGEAAEFLGTHLAHMFGKQSTAELEADVAKTKQILADFVTSTKSLTADLSKVDDELSLSGLVPGDAAVEKAKQKYAEQAKKISDYRATLIAANGQTLSSDELVVKRIEQTDILKSSGSSPEEKEAAQKALNDLKLRDADFIQAELARIGRDEVEQKALRDNEIAAGNAKRLADDKAFGIALVQAEDERQQKLSELNADLQQKLLQADNRGYEARLVGLRAALDKQVATITAGAEEKLNALDKEANAERLRADEAARAEAAFAEKAKAGGAANAEAQKQQESAAAAKASAQTRIEAIEKEAAAIRKARDAQIGVAKQSGGADVRIARENELRQATIAILSTEANAGSTAAKLAIDRLNTSREQQATAAALVAIAHDDKATAEQRKNAEAQLLELKRANSLVKDRGLEDSEIAILERQAALGDEAAKVKVEQLRLSREQIEAETKLNALIADGNASGEQKAEAQKQLAQLKQVQQQGNDNGVRDAGLFLLQQEAALGDKNAERQLQKIQLEKTYNAEKEKLLGIIRAEEDAEKKATSEADKAAARQRINDAKTELSGLDATEKKAIQKIGTGDGQPKLAALEQSNYLTGVSAKIGQEKDPYQPVVDAQKANTNVTTNILELLRSYLGQSNQTTKKQLR